MIKVSGARGLAAEIRPFATPKKAMERRGLAGQFAGSLLSTYERANGAGRAYFNRLSTFDVAMMKI
jgi:hypothetical protein